MNAQLINKLFLTALILLFSSKLQASTELDYDSGLESYKAGDYGKAVMYFESARKQGMDTVSLQYNLASSYYRVGRYEDAKTYFMLLNETEEMRDLAEYHLGLIAIKHKDGSQARHHFTTVVNTGEDKKLIKLSEKQLNALKPEEDRWKSHVFLNAGYDDNISSVSGDSVLDIADNFYELFASTDLLLAGRRNDGWSAEVALYGIEFSATDTNDLYNVALGLNRSLRLADWDTTTLLILSKSTYGGDDFQTISRLEIIGRKQMTKRDHLYLRYNAEDIRSDNAIYDYLEGWRQRARVEYRNIAANNVKHIYYELELNNRGELVTLTDSYEYSPTRHTIRGIYTQIINKKWWLIGDLAYQLSDFQASSTVDRQDNQLKLAFSANYHFDRTFKFTSRYQYTDNGSTVDRYNYDKSIIKIGLSKLF
ncbi:MAG: outer membrane beta-barrel protein [Proteobacteria bacterium]|nr:outer membrane beta-barrel protein [Pseudomonadota bacterium]